jgi:alpha-mannosidase
MASADEQDFMDLNPVMPGCFVSRIKLKQRTRQLTHRLVRAEADLANAAWIGAGRDGMDALGEMWRNLCLSNFHDAVTGTHIDTAYAELMEIYDRVEATVDDMLGPAPRNHALPARKRADALPQKICLGKFTCSVELGGLRECFFQGHDLFGSAKGTWQQPQWHIGELCLESDFGDAWGRRIPTVGNNTTALGAMHYLVNIDDDRVTWYGTYTGGHKKVRRLDWRTTLVCSDDGKRLDFFLDVWWDTESKRLRAIFPVADGGSEAIWETAFGHVQRTFDPKAINYTLWQADEQEYPAMNWVWKSVPGVGPNAGVALFNRGVPSCRWMPHRFDVSLLRSPESEFCQQEQSNWECWDNDGQRDTGHHRFAFSVWPHVHESTPFELTRAGLAFNDGCVDDLPFDVDGPVTVTCWKPAESGKGCVLRFYETNGKPGEVCLKFQQPVRIQPCNLLEAPTGDAAESNCYAIRLDPFKIHTLIICPVG